MQANITIMQGDQYAIPFDILASDGTPADGSTFAEVEIVVGSMRKTMTSGAVVYDAGKQAFLFPLTQEETFALTTGAPVGAQVRVKLPSGDVFGINLGLINITLSSSTEVL